MVVRTQEDALVPAVTSERFPVVPVGRHYPSWGTSVQHPLWASASTESPLYPDTLYPANLFGWDTVNTCLPVECLVIGDSLSSVKANLAGQIRCIGVTSAITRKTIHAQHLLDERWIVDNPVEVTPVVKQMMKERRQD